MKLEVARTKVRKDEHAADRDQARQQEHAVAGTKCNHEKPRGWVTGQQQQPDASKAEKEHHRSRSTLNISKVEKEHHSSRSTLKIMLRSTCNSSCDCNSST